MRLGLCLATMLTASSLAGAEAPLTIDQLLAQGCGDRQLRERLRQLHVAAPVPPCGHERARPVAYDVTRSPRTIVNCYELK